MGTGAAAVATLAAPTVFADGHGKPRVVVVGGVSTATFFVLLRRLVIYGSPVGRCVGVEPVLDLGVC